MILIIANPAAGRRDQRKVTAALNRIKKTLEHEGKVELTWVEQEGEAMRIARNMARAGTRMIVAAGGDGTINEVANGLAGTNTILSILPFGTENVLAKFLRLPLDPERCAREILLREPYQMDLGKIGDRYFLSFAGIGFDAQVILSTEKRLKRKYGSLAFVLTAFREFWNRRNQESIYHLNYDGKEIDLHSWFMLVGNIPRYGWQLPLVPSASPEDGKLDACVFPANGFWNRVKQTASVVRGNHYEKTTCFQFKTLSLESDPPMEIQVDGEVIGMTPCDVSIEPKSLWVRF